MRVIHGCGVYTEKEGSSLYDNTIEKIKELKIKIYILL
jgi:hypothetical protein